MIKKIKNFLLTNKFFRRIKNFLHRVFFPTLLKSFLVIATLLILVITGLKFFNPSYLARIYQKSSFYFLHYLNLDNREFDEINISGNNRVTDEQIIAAITEAKKQATKNSLNDYQPLIQNFITKIKAELPWVDQVMIARSMPNILNISITEYEPFAIWQNDGKKFITDKKGNLIPIDNNTDEFRHMVILSGKGANLHAQSLFNIFTIDPNLSANVYSATWIGDRRWDIRLENGLLIKLPENNISNAWRRLIKIYNMPGSIMGLKILDLRISDKIYLEYEDSVIKELKTL